MNPSSSSGPKSSSRSVLVVGSGYVAKNTLSSLVSKHGESVDVVAGVPDPAKFEPMDGVRAIKADLSDKASLAETLKKEGNFCRVFLVLPGHADRLQMGWNGLEAVREAGVLQVVLVSVLTAETQADDSCSSHFKPMGDNIKKLGKLELPSSRASSPTSMASRPSKAESDPSTCVRIQRRNVLHGWFPMKVKLVQISMPSLDPAARCGKPRAVDPKAQDNGLAELQRAFLGPYQAPKTNAQAVGAAIFHDLRRDLALRQELLIAEAARMATTAAPRSSFARLSMATPLAPQASSSLPLPLPIAPQASHVVTPNSLAYSSLLRAVQQQRKALQQQQPRWL